MKNRRILIGAAIVACLVFLVLTFKTGLDKEFNHPFDLLSGIHEGSAVIEMETLSKDSKVFLSSVYSWTPTNSVGPGVIDTPLGRYEQRKVGAYDPKKIKGSFTGRIEFWVERPWNGPMILNFEYVDGILRNKHYNYTLMND